MVVEPGEMFISWELESQEVQFSEYIDGQVEQLL